MVARIGAVVRFHDCSFVDNAESDPSMIAIEDLRGCTYTNADGLTVWETHCDDEYQIDDNGNSYKHHCKLKPCKLAPLPAVRQGEKREDVFAHVTAAAQALPRASDPAFRQVVGEQIARTGMTAPQLLHLPIGFDMALVGAPWGNGSSEWAWYVIYVMAGCMILGIICRWGWRIKILIPLYTFEWLGRAPVKVYNMLRWALGKATRSPKAVWQWTTDLVTELKEARANARECGEITHVSDEVAIAAEV